jgi:exopolysaccharide biosynthesis polyprenyl glycosylphosphotransferase
MPSWQRRIAWLLAGADLVAVGVAVLAAYLVRFGADSVRFGRVPLPAAAAVLVVGWMAALALVRAYDARVLGVGTEEFRRVVLASFVLFGAVAITSYVFKLTLSRGFVAVAMPLGAALLLVERLVTRRWLQGQRRRGRLTHRVVVVGSAAGVEQLAEQVRREPLAGYQLVGACTPTGADQLDAGDLTVVGRVDEVLAAVRRLGADTVAITASPEISPAEVRRIAWSLEGSGVDLMVAPSVTDVAGPRISVRPVGGLAMLYVDEPTFSGTTRVLKRTLDVTGALLGLLVLGIPLVLLGIATRLTSPGPALFRQVRIGRDGRQFRMIKLRTMYVDAEERWADLMRHNETDGLLFKVSDDPRVTPLGRFLRRMSIDELPQLLNVLRGDMSLVGPRPLAVQAEDFVGDVRRRHLVRPGITGLWQISGRRDTSWEDAVRLDLYYVENWSLTLDLTIMLRTALAVWKGDGAY